MAELYGVEESVQMVVMKPAEQIWWERDNKGTKMNAGQG